MNGNTRDTQGAFMSVIGHPLAGAQLTIWTTIHGLPLMLLAVPTDCVKKPCITVN